MMILANWKSNMTLNEARDWLEAFSQYDFDQGQEIVILPPFTLLHFVSDFIKEKNLPYKAGAQDVSPFDNGAYTGEISARQLAEFASFVLIGHSERRNNFSESPKMIIDKTKQALEQGLAPIVCVSDKSQIEDQSTGNITYAYEPISAIGTGNPEDPSVVGAFGHKIIYGGSVNPQNVANYTRLENVIGVLVGSESLSPQTFAEIIKNAS